MKARRRKTAGAGGIVLRANGHANGDGQLSKKAKAYAHGRLVQRCLAGDDEAWDRLYRECQPPLLAAIRLLLGEDSRNQDVVDEIASRVWYALFREDRRLLARYDPERHSLLEAYLMGLARIEWLRYARSEQRRQSVEFIGGCRSLAQLRVPDWEVAALLREFASQLTPGEQEFMEKALLAPREVEGDAITLSPTSVWQRRHRIKRKLRQFLRDDG